MEKRKNLMLVATLLLATSFTINAAEDNASATPSRFAFLQRVPGTTKAAAALTSIRGTFADLQNPESYGPRDARTFKEQGQDLVANAQEKAIAAKDAVVAVPGFAKDKAIAAKNAVVAFPGVALGGLQCTLSTLWKNLDIAVSAPFVVDALWKQIPDAYKAMALDHLPATFPGKERLALAVDYAGSFKASQLAGKGISKGFDWAQWLVRNNWIQRIENAVDQKVFNRIPLLKRVEGPYRKVLSVLTAYVVWTKVVLPYIVRSNRAGQWTEGKISDFVNVAVSALTSYIPTFGRGAAPAPAANNGDVSAVPAPAAQADSSATAAAAAPKPKASSIPVAAAKAKTTTAQQASSALRNMGAKMGIAKSSQRLLADSLETWNNDQAKFEKEGSHFLTGVTSIFARNKKQNDFVTVSGGGTGITFNRQAIIELAKSTDAFSRSELPEWELYVLGLMALKQPKLLGRLSLNAADITAEITRELKTVA